LNPIYTIGHGARGQEDFLRLLKRAGVEVLVDVRRWPTSRVPHFRREELERWLPEAGIEYRWLGDRLGGYRSGGYEKYMETAEFKEGLEQLLHLAQERVVALMCLEVSPLGCHRRFITRALLEAGVEVRHIISEREVRATLEPPRSRRRSSRKT
jgi:uncharacterized protein (DUF488 family)